MPFTTDIIGETGSAFGGGIRQGRRRIADTLPGPIPTAAEIQPPGLPSRIAALGLAPLAALGEAFETVDAPTRAAVGRLIGVQEGTGPEGRVSGLDILHRLGAVADPTDPILSDIVLGGIVEVLLSPLNLISFGASGVVKVGGKAVKVEPFLRRVGKASARLAAIRSGGPEAVRTFGREIDELTSFLNSPDTTETIAAIVAHANKRSPGILERAGKAPVEQILERIGAQESQLEATIAKLSEKAGRRSERRLAEATRNLEALRTMKGGLESALAGVGDDVSGRQAAALTGLAQATLADRMRAGIRESVLLRLPGTRLSLSLQDISPSANEAIIRGIEALSPAMRKTGQMLRVGKLADIFRLPGELSSVDPENILARIAQPGTDVAVVFNDRGTRELLKEMASVARGVRRNLGYRGSIEADKIRQFLSAQDPEQARRVLMDIKAELQSVQDVAAQRIKDDAVRVLGARIDQIAGDLRALGTQKITAKDFKARVEPLIDALKAFRVVGTTRQALKLMRPEKVRTPTAERLADMLTSLKANIDADKIAIKESVLKDPFKKVFRRMTEAIVSGNGARIDAARLAHEAAKLRLNPLETLSFDQSALDPRGLALSLALESVDAGAAAGANATGRSIAEVLVETVELKRALRSAAKAKDDAAVSQIQQKLIRNAEEATAKLAPDTLRNQTIWNALPPEYRNEAMRIAHVNARALEQEQLAGVSISALDDPGLGYAHRSLSEAGRRLLQAITAGPEALRKGAFGQLLFTAFGGPTQTRTAAFRGMHIHAINEFIAREVRLMKQAGHNLPFDEVRDRFFVESPEEAMLARMLASGRLRAAATYLHGFINMFRLPKWASSGGDMDVATFISKARLASLMPPLGETKGAVRTALGGITAELPGIDADLAEQAVRVDPKLLNRGGSVRAVREALSGTIYQNSYLPGDLVRAVMKTVDLFTNERTAASFGRALDTANNALRFWLTVGGIPLPGVRMLGAAGGAAAGAAAGAGLGAGVVAVGAGDEGPSQGAVATGAISAGIAGAVSGAMAGASGMLQFAPAFTIRNVVSNLWNMLLGGFRDFGTLHRAARTVWLARDATRRGGHGLTKAHLQALQLMEEAASHGAIQATRTGELRLLSEEAAARATPAPAPARVRAGNIIRFITKPHETEAGRSIMSINSDIESVMKLALYLDARGRGMGRGEAGDLVRKYLFDYSEISPTEARIRSLAFFYTWMRKNFALQFESLLNRPLYARTVITFGGERDGSLHDRILREHYRDRFSIPLIRNEDGSRTFFSFGLPPEDLNLMRPQSSYVVESIGDTVLRVASLAAPTIRVPVELASGRLSFSGGTAPTSSILGGLSPFTRAGNTLALLSGVATGQRGPEQMARLIGLLPERTLPTGRAELRKQIDELRALGDALVGSGSATRVPVITAREPESEEKVRRLNSAISRALGKLGTKGSQ